MSKRSLALNFHACFFSFRPVAFWLYKSSQPKKIADMCYFGKWFKFWNSILGFTTTLSPDPGKSGHARFQGSLYHLKNTAPKEGWSPAPLNPHGGPLIPPLLPFPSILARPLPPMKDDSKEAWGRPPAAAASFCSVLVLALLTNVLLSPRGRTRSHEVSPKVSP